MTTFSEALGLILDALGQKGDDSVTFGHLTVGAWPEGLLHACLNVRLVEPAKPASAIICPGCHQGCVSEVSDARVTESEPYIFCDQPIAHGRIDFDATLLKQWRCSRRLVAAFLAHDLGLRVKRFDEISGHTHLGLSRRLEAVIALDFENTARLRLADRTYELVDLLNWSGGRVSIDQPLLARLSAGALDKVVGGRQPSLARPIIKKRKTELRDQSVQAEADAILYETPTLRKALVVKTLRSRPPFDRISSGRLARLFVMRRTVKGI